MGEGDIKRLAAGEALSSEAKALLKAQNVTASDLQAIGQIFGNIALPFSPHRSPTVRHAELMDILSRCKFDSATTCQRSRSAKRPEEPALWCSEISGSSSHLPMTPRESSGHRELP